MSLRDTRIREIDLLDLLAGIDDGRVALPNFQRAFEWTDEEVRALIGTVLSGWPMGSLLIIQADPSSRDFYQPRNFEFAPDLIDNLELIVLDGQQRLTALYQAFYGKGASQYAIHLDRAFTESSIDAVDSALRSFKREKWETFYKSSTDAWKDGLLPASALRGPSEFFSWRDGLGVDNSERLTAAYRDNFAGLHRYRIPAVEIGSDLPPAAVARIFERVNRGGRRLSTFDLMVAKSFKPNFNLRESWDDVARERPDVFDYCRKDGLPILSLIALRTTGDLRSSAVLNLTGATIRDNFDTAVTKFDEAVQFAKRRLGILKSEWQAYNNILIVLAGLAYDYDLAQESKEIERWYWTTIFSGRYAVGANTVAVSDFRSLDNGKQPTSRLPILVREDLEECTRQHNGALHRAILCLLASNVGVNEFGDTGNLEERSAFERANSPTLDPPAHLRSLTFVLIDADEEILFPLAPSEQFFEETLPLRELSTLDSVMGTRIDGIAGFLSNVFGQVIPVTRSADGDKPTGQGGTDD